MSKTEFVIVDPMSVHIGPAGKPFEGFKRVDCGEFIGTDCKMRHHFGSTPSQGTALPVLIQN